MSAALGRFITRLRDTYQSVHNLGSARPRSRRWNDMNKDVAEPPYVQAASTRITDAPAAAADRAAAHSR